MRVILGDLLDGSHTAIAHGVNCHAAMRSGVARQLAIKYPEVEREYNDVCDRGDLRPGECLVIRALDGTTVYNCASQYYPGADARLDWLAHSLDSAFTCASELGHTDIALPLIGGGVGGLDPTEAMRVIVTTAHQFPDLDPVLILR